MMAPSAFPGLLRRVSGSHSRRGRMGRTALKLAIGTHDGPPSVSHHIAAVLKGKDENAGERLLPAVFAFLIVRVLVRLLLC